MNITSGNSRAGEKAEFNLDDLPGFGVHRVNGAVDLNVWFLGGDQEQGDDDAGDERRPHDEEFQESEKSTDRDGNETTEDKDSGLSREHIYRPEGTGTVARISWMTSLVVIRRPELLFRKTSRCAKTGTASSLTSSGVV